MFLHVRSNDYFYKQGYDLLSYCNYRALEDNVTTETTNENPNLAISKDLTEDTVD